MKARLSASLAHLLVSAIFIFSFASIVIFIWYPPPLYEFHSLSDVLKLVVAVDLILGPLLTLVVFNTLKPRSELVRDMSVIVLVQVIALSWGIHTAYKVRPVFVVFHIDTLYSVTRDDIISSPLADSSAMPSFWQRPRLVYTRPLDKQEAARHVVEMMTKGAPDVMFQTDRYLPAEEYRDQMLARAIDLQQQKKYTLSQRSLHALVQDYSGTVADYAFFPLEQGPFKSIVAMRKSNLSLIALLGPG